ncbi:MAG TPA: urease accessory protein [Gammaproteobacteria bacterium]|nr:urease accessory protein [Gammaproteobacteria bacterium]
MLSLAKAYHPGDQRWYAGLELEVVRSQERGSVLKRIRHQGPLKVQRPFYPEGQEVCHLYILHPPGGVVGGDLLEIDVLISEGAHLLLTSPASNKFYRSAGEQALLTQSFDVATGAVLEWLPQDTIYFEGAKVTSNTQFHLHQDAKLCAWEIQTFGRPAAEDYFANGTVRTSLEVWCQKRPIFVERGSFVGGDRMMYAPWGLHAQPVMGTLVMTNRGQHSCASIVRDTLGVDHPLHCTEMADLFVARYLGHCALQARALFEQVWTLLRPLLLNRNAHAPRVWRT